MENHGLLIGLGSILVLGIGARWLAWRLHLPSILLLLLTGFVAGPLTGFLNPDKLLGDLLFPVVSLAVAIILFEGGMSLNIKALKEAGFTIGRLVTIGALVTWGLATLAARYFLAFDWGLSLLMGAILIVTGPTVVIPLLMFIRPIGRVGSIAKWEAIVNDPIGAIIAVLVFQTLIHGGHGSAAFAVFGLAKSLLLGGAVGVVGALLILVLLQRHWLPDLLQEPVTLMVVIGSFIAANMMLTESGLVSVTVMGVILANQRHVSVRHIIEFKERLRVLLISGLFVLLAARLSMRDLLQFDGGTILFLLALLLVNRPVTVLLATVGSKLTTNERLFLSWMAPRGIVAAAVASVFSLELAFHGYPQAERLMPQVFFVIIATVVVYGLTAGSVARGLGLAQETPQGVLIVGAHQWARDLARAIKAEGINVLLVDTNLGNIARAKAAGLEAFNENIVSLQAMENVPLHSVGRLFALTPNDEANSLAALRFSEVFGRSEVYQLTPGTEADGRPDTDAPRHLRGRLLFGRNAGFARLNDRYRHGAGIRTIELSDKFSYQDFRERFGDAATLLAVVTSARVLRPVTASARLTPEPGDKIIVLIDSPALKRDLALEPAPVG